MKKGIFYGSVLCLLLVTALVAIACPLTEGEGVFNWRSEVPTATVTSTFTFTNYVAGTDGTTTPVTTTSTATYTQGYDVTHPITFSVFATPGKAYSTAPLMTDTSIGSQFQYYHLQEASGDIYFKDNLTGVETDCIVTHTFYIPPKDLKKFVTTSSTSSTPFSGDTSGFYGTCTVTNGALSEGGYFLAFFMNNMSTVTGMTSGVFLAVYGEDIMVDGRLNIDAVPNPQITYSGPIATGQFTISTDTKTKTSDTTDTKTTKTKTK